jgi:MFS family permease
VSIVGFQWLVTAVLGTHFAYLAYLVLGGFLAWRWPKMIFPHLFAAVWGVLIVLNLVDCPLTIAEAWARRLAGDQPVTGGFIDRYVTGVIYPGRYLVEARLGVTLVVVASYVGAYLFWRARRQARLDTVRKDAVGAGGTATV